MKFRSFVAQELRRIADRIESGELDPYCLEIEKQGDTDYYVLKLEWWWARERANGLDTDTQR